LCEKQARHLELLQSGGEYSLQVAATPRRQPKVTLNLKYVVIPAIGFLDLITETALTVNIEFRSEYVKILQNGVLFWPKRLAKCTYSMYGRKTIK
jgi:hypothetical protein